MGNQPSLNRDQKTVPFTLKRIKNLETLITCILPPWSWILYMYLRTMGPAFFLYFNWAAFSRLLKQYKNRFLDDWLVQQDWGYLHVSNARNTGFVCTFRVIETPVSLILKWSSVLEKNFRTQDLKQSNQPYVPAYKPNSSICTSTNSYRTWIGSRVWRQRCHTVISVVFTLYDA